MTITKTTAKEKKFLQKVAKFMQENEGDVDRRVTSYFMIRSCVHMLLLSSETQEKAIELLQMAIDEGIKDFHKAATNE